MGEGQTDRTTGETEEKQEEKKGRKDENRKNEQTHLPGAWLLLCPLKPAYHKHSPSGTASAQVQEEDVLGYA